MGLSGSNTVVGAALNSVRRHFVLVMAVSAVANLLLLAGPLFMLQVYDRVLTSGSVPTLLVLSLAVTVAYAFLGLFEWVRMKMLARVAAMVEGRLEEPAFRASVEANRLGADGQRSEDPLKDVETLRQYIASPGLLFLFDAPWLPFFLFIVYLLHPVLALVAVIGAVVLIGLTILNERALSAQMNDIAEDTSHQNRLIHSSRNNGEAVAAMGMSPALLGRQQQIKAGMIDRQIKIIDTGSGFSTATKVLRMLLQSVLLATGAALAVAGEMSAGAMIASSILAARALSPVEQAVGSWRQFITFRRAWSRLGKTLGQTAPRVAKVFLPAPSAELAVADLALVAKGCETPILSGVQFNLVAGEALGVIGPSASGKTTLARAITGLWQPEGGEIRLDGAKLDQWPADTLGRHIGYLPQRVSLFAGTVGENIARFAPGVSSEDVVAAAKAADVHELILRLPNGYDTHVEAVDNQLSAGQMQRIGLARALFGQPFLIVLDEPNSNLDNEGEAALMRAIGAMRKKGSIVIVMTHRPNVISATDKILVLAGGKQVAFGAREDILKSSKAPAAELSDDKAAEQKSREAA